MPVLAIILFALVEFGLMLNNQVAIVNASRDGARVAALQNGDPNQTTDVQTAVSDAEKPLIGCATAAPAISSATNSLGGGQIATWSVKVSCKYTPITPLGSILALIPGGKAGSSSCTGGGYTICQTTTMRDPSCNQPSCSP